MKYALFVGGRMMAKTTKTLMKSEEVLMAL